MFIEAGNHLEGLAAGREKLFFAFHGDFLECLETIGYEGGRNNQKLFDSLFGQFFENVVGIGLYPRVTAESGLERDGMFAIREIRPFYEGVACRGYLGFIAGAVDGRAGAATVFDNLAVSLRRIGFR